MKITFLLLICMLTVCSYCQPPKKTYSNTRTAGFIKQVTKNFTDEIYFATSLPYKIKDIKNALQADTLKEALTDDSNVKYQFLVISAADRRTLTQNSFKWSAADKTSLPANQNKFVDTDTIRIRQGYIVYKPIFLNNGNFCLFYYDYMCPMCGHGTLALYKKEKGIWKYWLGLYGWAN